ncbi:MULTISPECIES: hypothetical protein [Streptomyces]|uniref:hypothetical protein n=1 Tax=Streptomyces TaxID=1883 RepID=UPI000A3A2D9B|nr:MULTISPECIES: hypothetical protein [Streptomyces]MYQ97395.1 hypothetical protein [Streptomyces sp. SID6139]MYR19740.1 hypothetical protein [Streptomyces sp. SID6137]
MSLTDVKIRSPRSDGAPDTPDPRETMRALPGFLRYPLTVFTGKPLTEQTRLPWIPTFHLAAAVLAGSAVSSAAWALGGWWLLALLPGQALTLHGLRNLRMMV